MDDASPSVGLPPLPPVLAVAFAAATSGGAKRERTQGALVRAAVQVFCARGMGPATIQEVAQVAGMTPGTVYNHFPSKEALVERTALVLAESLCRAIAESQAGVADAAEKMAIGQRRYIWLAEVAPAWALLLLEVMAANPLVAQQIEAYPLADLRLGVRQKRFKVPTEAVALDVIEGVCGSAMRRVALGQAPARHDVAVATTVLRALGMAADEAAEVARRPLPDLVPLQSAEATRARRSAQRTPRAS